MANYTLTINMDNETVDELMQQGRHLLAFKAVKAVQGAPGRPLVWFRTDAYSLGTTIGWMQDYKAYDSLDEPVPHAHIHVTASQPADLGDVFTIVDAHGGGEVTPGGKAGAITIRSNVTTRFTAGISQKNDAGFAPVCAFPLQLGFTNFLTPVEKVLVMFAPNPVETSTVIVRAISPGLLVNFADETDRAVSYNMLHGWDCGGAPWCKPIEAGADLTSLLIETSASD